MTKEDAEEWMDIPNGLETAEALDAVWHERERQKRRWSTDHDRHHERFEWVGLIALYAAQGKFVEAGALCLAAIEVTETTHD